MLGCQLRDIEMQLPLIYSGVLVVAFVNLFIEVEVWLQSLLDTLLWSGSTLMSDGGSMVSQGFSVYLATASSTLLTTNN